MAVFHPTSMVTALKCHPLADPSGGGTGGPGSLSAGGSAMGTSGGGGGEETPIFIPLCSIFRRFLKKRGLKFTTERALILDAVVSKDDEIFEAEKLLYGMYGAGHRVSKATIYRTLKHLVEAHILREVLLDSKIAHYQLIYGKKPKDHLVCVDDDAMTEFFSPELVELRDKIARQHGLEAVGHRFLIYAVRRPGASGESAAGVNPPAGSVKRRRK